MTYLSMPPPAAVLEKGAITPSTPGLGHAHAQSALAIAGSTRMCALLQRIADTHTRFLTCLQGKGSMRGVKGRLSASVKGMEDCAHSALFESPQRSRADVLNAVTVLHAMVQHRGEAGSSFGQVNMVIYVYIRVCMCTVPLP